jgi:thioredoxin reductase (NADPH)
LPDSWLFYLLYTLVLAVPLALYIRRQLARERRVREAAAKGAIFTEGPRGQHPHIDVSNCIGCQGCTTVCPEGDVLGMVGGKAALIKPHNCIGHGLCAEACPVGAIRLVTGTPSVSASLPYLTPEYETSVRNLFIAGELGGLALIKNAVYQGRECIDTIAQRFADDNRLPQPGVYDVVIIGAGPAGISATLRAIERKLSYLTLERESLGGTVSKYPRQKLVMTSPIEFPMGIRLKRMQLSKESLLEFWGKITAHEQFRVQSDETVESIRHQQDGSFIVSTPKGEYRGRSVVLAIGRSGTPQKLGVKGEDLPKVMYRLLEADHYIGKDILVVGGGDSAVEAAMGLAVQKGNRVTLSYRKGAFSRIKERNTQRLQDAMRSPQLRVVLNSTPVEITEAQVILDVNGTRQELPNDFVWIFAGGVAPNEFLKKIGIQFGAQDVTREAVREAREALTVA